MCDKIGVTRHIGEFCEKQPLKPLLGNSFTYFYSENQMVQNVTLLSHSVTSSGQNGETAAGKGLQPHCTLEGVDVGKFGVIS